MCCKTISKKNEYKLKLVFCHFCSLHFVITGMLTENMHVTMRCFTNMLLFFVL